jgi:hypothetical protein
VAGWQWLGGSGSARVMRLESGIETCVKFEIGTIQVFVKLPVIILGSVLSCGYLKVTPEFDSLGDGLTDISTGIYAGGLKWVENDEIIIGKV